MLENDVDKIRDYIQKENIKVDYSHLVGCADYNIPQSLRNLNILVYDNELATLVDNKHELEENSVYEI